MGFYRLSVSMISRSEGRSAVAAAAYRSGSHLSDERYGKIHDYRPRRGIVCSAIMTPEDAPFWSQDRETLWNKAESAERRKNSQVAREVELALPHQVSHELRVELVETFIREQLLPRGMIVDYAIHAPNRRGDGRNFHAHLLTTTRALEGEEFSRTKDREACSVETLEAWRKSWSEIQNRIFNREGILREDGTILHVDHRSFEERGIDRLPSRHLGPNASAMERRGVKTDLGDMNRDVARLNQLRDMKRRTEAVLHEMEQEFERSSDNFNWQTDRDDRNESLRKRQSGHDREP